MKFKTIILYILIASGFLTSCEEYLDVSRETSEITEADIFTSYLETKEYLNQIYQGIHNFSYAPAWNQIQTDVFIMYPDAASDEYIHPGTQSGSPIMAEEMWYDVDWFTYRMDNPRYDHNFWPNWRTPWNTIRAACLLIEKAPLIEDADQEQINEIIGQAYYGRAYAYHYLLIMHGGMPYFTKAISADDDFNFERLTYHETVNNIVADLDSAAAILPSDWKIPGADPFATKNQGRFTSAAAKALKSRILLYDASPFSYFADEIMGYSVENNEQDRWERAAEAAWEAIEYAEQNGYSLVPGDSVSYKSIFRGEWATSEYLHTIISERVLEGHNINSWSLQRMFLPGILVGPLDDRNRGVDVPQDMVDKFEAVQKDAGGNITRALSIEDAITAGFYNEQNPYENRDPRFRYNIIHHGSVKPGYGPDGSDGQWNFSRDSRQAGKFNDDFDKNSTYLDNQSSYYVRKYWMGESEVLYNISEPWPWIIIRMAELYLNYAEAANQAYGPSGAAPGASLSAVDAVNIVRNRVGMPNVDPIYTSSKDDMHKRIFNERAVELCFEFIHRYIDVRRWRLLETEEYQETPHIMWITDTDDLINYPTGYKYEIRPYEVNNVLYRRTYQLKNYFMPISKNDIQKVVTFKQNPGY